jgi:hypothetical protein
VIQVNLSDDVIARRASLAERLTTVIESDERVRRCKRIVFTHEGGALIEVELVHDPDTASRQAIANSLEIAIKRAVAALPWLRIQIV